MKDGTANLFEFFELYAYFVYNFCEYVSALFQNLSDQESKIHIYDNLLDEIGYLPGKSAQWNLHHGELYRSFLSSLRQTSSYRNTISNQRSQELDMLSRKISQHFYARHHEILLAGNDRVTIAAFSSIEGWVSREYALWREILSGIGDEWRSIDMRTIDLHCECDVEHSRVLDNIIRRFIGEGDKASTVSDINSGLLRGIALSAELFDNIERALHVPSQPD